MIGSKLSELCDIQSGGTPSRSEPEYWGGNIPWAKISDIEASNGALEFTEETISDKGLKAIRDRLFQPGTLLFAMYGSVGKSAIANKVMSTNQAILGIVIRDEGILDMSYLRHWLTSQQGRFELDARGVTQKNLSAGYVRDLEIPLPPLDEQKRIAAILDKADGIRRKRQQAIELTDQLLRSVFLDMFGDPVTNPKGWRTISGEQLFTSMRYGTSTKCIDVQEPGSLPVLRIPNVLGGRIDPDELKYAKLDAKEIRNLSLHGGELLFVRTNGNPNYIGRCAVIEEVNKGCLYASYLIKAEIDDQYFVSPIIVKEIVSFPTYRVKLARESKTTAGNYNISTAGLRNLTFIVPTEKEQRRFLAFLRQREVGREKLLDALRTAEVLLGSLSQNSFKQAAL